MASFPLLCLKDKKKYTIVIDGKYKINLKYVLLFVVWVFFSAFRYIDANGIGGREAYHYINYFETCIYDTTNILSIFRIYNKYEMSGLMPYFLPHLLII